MPVIPVIEPAWRNGKINRRDARVQLNEPPWRRGRKPEFNLKLRADIPVPFSSVGRRLLMPFEALLGPVPDEVGV